MLSSLAAMGSTHLWPPQLSSLLQPLQQEVRCLLPTTRTNWWLQHQWIVQEVLLPPPN
jgi:hypothetical protein